MRLEQVLRNPVLRRALEVGEERMGHAMGRLLSSDRVTSGLQRVVTSALQARSTFERGVQQALHAANLPSREDVDALKRRLEEIEDMLDGLGRKVERRPPDPGGDAS